jgi:hypothetical protein
VAAIATICVGWGAVAQASVVYTDDFNSYATATPLSTTTDWYAADTEAIVYETTGVAGTNGLSGATKPFNWAGHTFQWSDPALTSLTIGMDIQASAATATGYPFKEDRIGWTTSPSTIDTATEFCIGLNNSTDYPGGFNIASYYKSTNGKSREYTFATYTSPITENAWYRVRAQFTKLTDTSASIVVTVQSLDSTGAVVDTLITGTMADTATWSNPPPATLFSGTTMCPMFKNYDEKAYGNMDNAYLEIVPEPATMSFLLAGLLFVGRRSR